MPSNWKVSDVVPIYKSKGNSANTFNYRPISHVSDLQDYAWSVKFVMNMLILLTHNLLSGSQFGFRPGGSQEAILCATHDWHLALQKGYIVLAVFFDLSKTFNFLFHDLILDSLLKVNIRGGLHKW